jgi:hypothetical protein
MALKYLTEIPCVIVIFVFVEVQTGNQVMQKGESASPITKKGVSASPIVKHGVSASPKNKRGGSASPIMKKGVSACPIIIYGDTLSRLSMNKEGKITSPNFKYNDTNMWISKYPLWSRSHGSKTQRCL